MTMKRVLIVYYSRSGFTRKIAEAVAGELDADIEEIRESKIQTSIFGYIAAALDIVLGRGANISETQYQPGYYDVVIIGTPVWASRPAPAIQTYVRKQIASLPATAWFCTLRSSGSEMAFAKMEELVEHPPCARLALTDSHIKSGGFQIPLQEFVERIKTTVQATNV